MFGFPRKPSVKLDPNQLARLRDEQLYMLFVEDKWAQMDKASRLALLQEVENRRARLDGRKPITVLDGGRKEFANPASLGYYNDSERVIRINYRYLEGRSPHHGPFGALDVVIHEGRHAMQWDTVREHPERVAQQVLKEWLGSMAKYCPPPRQGEPEAALKFAVYAMQSIEIDARRVAREALDETARALRAQGLDTRGVEAQRTENLREEYNIIWLVQKTLTAAKLDALEKLVLSAMRERYPEMDVSNLRLFDHARAILNAPRIETLKNPVDLILSLDRYEQEKLDKVKEKNLNRVEEDPKDRIAQAAHFKFL